MSLVIEKVDQKFIDINEQDENEWKHRELPECDMDLIIISSYGDEWDPSIEVVPKQQNSAIASNSTTVLAHKEMEAIIDKCREDKGVHLRNVWFDWPGFQLSKHDLLERIKTLFNKCDNEGSKSAQLGHHKLYYLFIQLFFGTLVMEKRTLVTGVLKMESLLLKIFLAFIWIA